MRLEVTTNPVQQSPYRDACALADFLVGAAVKDTGRGDYPPVRIRGRAHRGGGGGVAPGTRDAGILRATDRAAVDAAAAQALYALLVDPSETP